MASAPELPQLGYETSGEGASAKSGKLLKSAILFCFSGRLDAFCAGNNFTQC